MNRCRKAVLIGALWGATFHGLAAKEFRANSPDLGMEFRTNKTAAEWCEQVVRVRIGAKSKAAFEQNHEVFQQTVGRVRGALIAECKKVERIEFEGVVGEQIVYRAEVSRVARWRLISVDVATGKALCPQIGSDNLNCSRRTEAFHMAVSAMTGRSFSKTLITRMLEGGEEENDLEFRSGDVVGQVRIVPRDSMPNISETASGFATAVTESLLGQCIEAPLKIVEPKNEKDHTALRGFSCATKGTAQTNSIVVKALGPSLYVFSIGAFRTPVPEVGTLADQLFEALKQKGVGH